MQLTRLAISRPIAILMIVGAFLVLGVVSYVKLPAELQPKVDFPGVVVITNYPGTGPEEMESLITKPIEDAISGVSGVKQISSSSQQGVSVVNIDFYLGTDLNNADADIIQKIDAIRDSLPAAAQSPDVLKEDTTSEPVIYLSMQSSKRSLIDLNRIATNTVKPLLAQATDVGSITIYGGDTREISVAIPQQRLNAYGVTVSDVAKAINNSNVNVASGFIQRKDQYYNVRLVGEYSSVQEVMNDRLILNGTPVMLKDIANVTDSTAELTADSWLNGERTLTIVVQKTSDGNTLNAVSSVKKQVIALRKFLPSDVRFVTISDQGKLVTDNLNDVVTSLFLGSLMAILVVYIFLHNLRGTIIVALALPTSMVATFIPIEALGYTLNSQTLLGLSLAVGILVDDSIVVLENINRHLALGEEPAVAAINGRTEIGLAALILTSVDLVVFLPIAFMGGIIGEFFRSFGMTVAFATMFSLFISFTLTPMLAAKWYKKGEKQVFTTGFAGAFDRGFGRFERTYQNALRACLRHPWVTVMIANGLLVFGFIGIVPNLGFRFAPDQDRNTIQVQVESPAGTSLSYTAAICREIERRVRANDQLNYDTQFISTTLGSSDSGGEASGSTGTQYAQIRLQLWDKRSVWESIFPTKSKIHLRSHSDADDAIVVRNVLDGITGAKITAANLSGFGGGGAPLEVDVTGPNFPQLLDAAKRVQDMMKAIPGTYDTDVSFKNSQPEVQIRLDRIKAPEYGLNLQQVSSAIADAVQGNVTAKYRDPEDGQQYDIRTQLQDSYRNDPELISNIVVGYTKSGQPITAGQVANITIAAGPVKIDRLNRERLVAVTAYLLPGYQVGNISTTLNNEIQSQKFDQVNFSFGGEAQLLGDEVGYLFTAVILGIVLSFMLMAALFNNLVYPLSIMLSLPQAWVGGFIALFIAKEPLNLFAAIGIVLLNGIVNKNAILLVDYTNTLRARGYKRIDALLEAGPTRMRPILMTSLAIVVSSLPTALALGRGGSFRQSLAVTVIGGIILSLVITPIVIPCAYLIFDNFTNFVGRIIGGRPKVIIRDFDPAPLRLRGGGGNGSNGGSSSPNSSNGYGNNVTALSRTETDEINESPFDKV